MSDILRTQPLVDTGSDVFSRYRYQADITLPFCLRCAVTGDIICVIPEHLEDIALQTNSGWRFIQVKSRNPERRPWGLLDLLSSDGALRSLFRTHTQTLDVNASLEILLEGAVRTKDPISFLRSEADHSNEELIAATVQSLGIEKDEAQEFLARVTLLQPPVPRPQVSDANLLLIQQQNPTLTLQEASDIYNRLMSEIERAMRAEPLGVKWPTYVIDPNPEVSERLKAKMLTRPHLQRIVGPLSQAASHYLLRRITDSITTTVSVLERKMREGGATDRIIEHARALRANAQLRLLTLQARSLYTQDNLIADLEQRLEIYVIAKQEGRIASSTPALDLWRALLDDFNAHAAVIDANRIMDADPMLLLGHVCELSDRCIVNWGVAHAH